MTPAGASPRPVADHGGALPPAPPVAAELFGDRLPSAVRFAELLAGPGSVRGLLGPREVPRVWERHLLNAAVVAPAFPAGAHVVDVGSGAGLPGIALALARPDLRFCLLDSMSRRCVFMTEVIGELGLTGRVEVVRARIEDHDGRYDVATARAVAALDTLARWTAPRVRDGGLLVLLRGERAADEVAANRDALLRAGWKDAAVQEFSRGAARATVVRAVRAAHA